MLEEATMAAIDERPGMKPTKETKPAEPRKPLP